MYKYYNQPQPVLYQHSRNQHWPIPQNVILSNNFRGYINTSSSEVETKKETKISLEETFKLPWRSIVYFLRKGLVCIGIFELIPIILLSTLIFICSIGFIISSVLTGFVIYGVVLQIIKSEEITSPILDIIIEAVNNNLLVLGITLGFFFAAIFLFVLMIVTIGIFLFPYFIRLVRTVELIEEGKKSKAHCNPFKYCCWFPEGFSRYLCLFLGTMIFYTILIVLKNTLAISLQVIPGIGTILGLLLHIFGSFNLQTLLYTSLIFIMHGKRFGSFGFVWNNVKISSVFGLSIWLVGFIPIIGIFKIFIGMVAGTLLVLQSGSLEVEED